MFTPNPVDLQRNAHNFLHHPPRGDQADRHAAVRARLHVVADFLLTVCPPGRELSLALTSLETAMMWGNAAIARGLAEAT